MDKKIRGGHASAKKLDVDKAYNAARDRAPRPSDDKSTKNESKRNAMPAGTLRKPNGERPAPAAGNKVRFAPGFETALENRTHLGEILDAPPEQNRLSTVLDEELGEECRNELSRFIDALASDGTPGNPDVFDVVNRFEIVSYGTTSRAVWNTLDSTVYEDNLTRRFQQDPSGLNLSDVEKVKSHLAMYRSMIGLVQLGMSSKDDGKSGIQCFQEVQDFMKRDGRKDDVAQATTRWLGRKKFEKVEPLMKFLVNAQALATAADTPHALREASFFDMTGKMLETVEAYSPPD